MNIVIIWITAGINELIKALEWGAALQHPFSGTITIVGYREPQQSIFLLVSVKIIVAYW